MLETDLLWSENALTLSFCMWYFFFEYHPIQVLEKIEDSKHGQAGFFGGFIKKARGGERYAIKCNAYGFFCCGQHFCGLE